MPWTVFTQKTGLSFGSQGSAYWTKPVELFPINAADFFEMTYPASVVPLDARPSWCIYEGRDYGVGGWSDNILITEHMEIVRQGIQAPNTVPDATLSGTGLTAALICYLTYYDDRTGERSSLSAPSATLNASNQGVLWQNFPTPLDGRVTHIELWRSVDGSLPRLVMRRQIGVTSVQESVAVGDLGEAFVEEFERFPRCRVNAIYHERQVMAGNDEHPDTLYLSLLNQPERWGGLTLRTRNGEPIIGLVVVRDRLLVLCPFSSYTVDGFTEDDLTMQIAQPEIGCISHHAIQVIHGMAWIPTHLGLYISDGSGWFYVMDDVQTKWGEQYRAHRDAYEASFSVHDPIAHVYMIYVGLHDDIPIEDGGGSQPKVWWVADYESVVSQLGGGYGQPNWTYDASERSYDCAALLALPGGRRQEVAFGSCDGIARVGNDEGDADDDGDTYDKRVKVRHGANFMADVGGNVAQGKRFPDLDVFMQSEANSWILKVFGGNEYAWETVNGGDIDPAFLKTVAASALDTGAGGFVYEKKGTHPFKMPKVVGRAYTLEWEATNPVGMEYRGHQIYWKEGPAVRVAVEENDPPS